MDKCIYNGKVINSFDIAADIDLEMEIRQCHSLKCCDPNCNAPLLYKHGKKRSPYFAHITANKECDYDRYSSKKSEVFKKVQQEIYDVLKKKYGRAVNIDIKLLTSPSHFTPIILNGIKSNFAIDITDKRITADKLQSRKGAYADLGYIGIQIIVDDAASRELSECDDLYLPERFEINKSANNSAVVYDKTSNKYYLLQYDKTDYDKKILKKDILSSEFNISEMEITIQGISVPRLNAVFTKWKENRQKSYQEYLDKRNPTQYERYTEKYKDVTSFDYIEYHKKTGRYAGEIINGVRESLCLNEIRIKKGIQNYFKAFSDAEIEELINNAFECSISGIQKLLNKMYQANDDEKAVFARIYKEYLNAERTEEITERIKILEYVIKEAEIFK